MRWQGCLGGSELVDEKRLFMPASLPCVHRGGAAQQKMLILFPPHSGEVAIVDQVCGVGGDAAFFEAGFRRVEGHVVDIRGGRDGFVKDAADAAGLFFHH